MSDPIQQALEGALEHHRAGRLAEAEQVYRGILAHYPNHPNALGLLGAIAHQTGNSTAAEQLLERAARLNPGSAGTHNNLGLVRLSLGRLQEAKGSFEEALGVDPQHAAALNNLGEVFFRLGRREDALACFQRAVDLSPDNPDVLTNLGEVLLERGFREQALALHRRAVALAPNHANAHSNLGKALAEVDAKGAADAFARAIELEPTHMLALTNLGVLRVLQGYPAQALALHDRALKVAPQYAPAHMDRGIALLPLGRIDEAIASQRKALELDPSAIDPHDNLLWAMLFDPHAKPAAVFGEFRNWAERFAEPLTVQAVRPQSRARTAESRLRIGYVSGDFRDHAVAHFIEPVLAAHERSRVEVFCYSNVRCPDAFTQRMQALGHVWRDIVGLSDDAIVRQIRDDDIEVLIDLAGHSARHKLLVFARRPAPIQATWLGYPNTTGMRAIDYWITDAHCDPPGMTESLAAEKLLRLPRTFTCFDPPHTAMPVNELPALSAKRVTFGSFNMASKINDDVIELWSRVLAAAPNARLLIVTAMVRDPDVHVVLRERFARYGITADQLDLRPVMEVEPYLRTHHEVDIILDTFPFTGHTVTLHALWMGCPVVTLAGNTHISRRGVSVMNNLGLPELIAADKDAYVRIASDLARDITRLSELRRTLRDRMTNSPLMDARTFTRELEEALLRVAWASRPSV